MSYFDSSYKDSLKAAVMGKLTAEDTGAQVKTMIWIILSLILLSCCALCVYNNFDMQKIFSSFNVNILLSTNCLTVMAVILAMIYGFNKVSRDPSTLTKYIPSAFTPTPTPTPNVGSMPSVLPTAQTASSFFNSLSGGFSSVASTPIDN